jgi:thiol-disulfide isomerase/thioredoxin
MLPGWLATVCVVLGTLAAASSRGGELIGQPAREWHLTNWFNSRPLALKELRGKVVLLRWWTAPGCNYCRRTAPALNEFHNHYSSQGLRVVGAYHHKSDQPLNVREVKRHADRFGFKFPIAIDIDWRTLEDWWLNKHDRAFTSVTFLLDRKGVIRYIHPGGSYEKGDEDYKELKKKIEALLAEE